MFDFFNYYNFSLFLGGLVALFAGTIVYFNDSSKKQNVSWLLLNISSAIWSFGYFVMIISSQKNIAELANLILHYGAIFIPPFYLFFILTLTNQYERYKKIFLLIFPFTAFFIFVNPSHYFIKETLAKYPFRFAPDAGPLYSYFTAYFFIIVVCALLILLKSILLNSDSKSRVAHKFVLISSIAGFIGGSSVFLLTFNINLPPYPIILFSIYPIIIAYTILKHNLFNVKVIATEFLVSGMWIFLIFRTFLANSLEEQIINLSFLIIVIILGLLIIKSVHKEVVAREQIENLARELEKANVRLTEADRQKSEFVSIASHQLRGPLAAIKGYGSLILEGSFGVAPTPIREAVQKMFDSSQSLVVIVQDYLDVSRIEQGRMKYSFSLFDLKELVESIVSELDPTIKKSGLKLSYSFAPQTETFKIFADIGKIKQAIGNIIDNATKYTKIGSIEIRLQKNEKNNTYLISIKDTGVGIPADALSKLFNKFTRAPNANEVNVMGSGLGLYVAAEMVRAHHGRVWAESVGVGHGSTFYIELPQNKEKEHEESLNKFAQAI